MTRNRKVDPLVLEREYIYDAGNPPISLTELAEKHGMARSGIADKARIGRWYERREEFRRQLGEKVVMAMGDSWVAFETATREKMMQLGTSYLDKYMAALEAGEIKPDTRGMLGVAAMVRALMNDVAQSPPGEEELLDPDSVPFTDDRARQVLDEVRRLRAGNEEPAGPVGTGRAAAAGED